MNGKKNIDNSTINSLPFKIKNIIPNKKLEINKEIMNTQTNPTRYFQWLNVENNGLICILDKIVEEDSITFIEFTDGSRCNIDFVIKINEQINPNKLIGEIISPQFPYTFGEEIIGGEPERWADNADGVSVCVDPGIPGRKVRKVVAPQRMPNAPQYNFAPSSENQQIAVPPPIIENSISSSIMHPVISKPSNPVYDIIEKTKKTDKEISFEITLSLPEKNIFDIVKDNFEDGEDIFIQYILDKIDLEFLKASLKDGIGNLYKK